MTTPATIGARVRLAGKVPHYSTPATEARHYPLGRAGVGTVIDIDTCYYLVLLDGHQFPVSCERQDLLPEGV